MKPTSLFCIALSSLFPLSLYAQPDMAEVSGFARSFLADDPIAGAKITVLETGRVLKTYNDGHFGPILYPVGKPITLLFEKWGYMTTQSGTVIVPKAGLTQPYNNITFQVPTTVSYYALAKIIGATIDDNSCHVATTIIKHHMTLNDVPQGEEDAEITLSPDQKTKPFYFDIFDSGPWKGKTNPFTRDLTLSSRDGGAAYFNLPPSDKPYTISAKKAGVKFSEAQFICRKGVFINISPPLGPMVQAD